MIFPRALIFPLTACALTMAGLAAAGAEPPTARSDATSLRTCVEPPSSSSTSWTPYDDHTILVRSGGRTFQVTTNRCPRLADPLPTISLKVLGGGSICSPHDVQLFVGDSADSIPSPCFIQSITPLSADQAKALQSRRR